MLKFLQNTVLTDIRFLIINSKQTSDHYASLLELVKGSGIRVYQETREEPIWRKLEGGKDDMFVYDRCGRLTYYVPYPLSALHDIPIVHTTLLSSYFDHPCGKVCSVRTPHVPRLSPVDVGNETRRAQPESRDRNIKRPKAFPLNPNVTKEIYEDQLLPNVVDSGQKMTIDLVSSSGIKSEPTIDGSGDSGSGSGDSPLVEDSGIGQIRRGNSKSRPKVTVNILTSLDLNESLASLPSIINSSVPLLSSPISEHSIAPVEPFGVRSVWKIWQFFVGGTGNESGPVTSTGNETSLHSIKSSSANSSILSSQGIALLTKRPPFFINPKDGNLTSGLNQPTSFNGTEIWLLNGKRCLGFDKSVCVDISVSKLLRARLCCLNEVSGSLMGPGKGFRCAGYTKSICNKMFPLIKCCLKDFHHILGKYLNADGSSSQSSPSFNIG